MGWLHGHWSRGLGNYLDDVDTARTVWFHRKVAAGKRSSDSDSRPNSVFVCQEMVLPLGNTDTSRPEEFTPYVEQDIGAELLLWKRQCGTEAESETKTKTKTEDEFEVSTEAP